MYDGIDKIDTKLAKWLRGNAKYSGSSCLYWPHHAGNDGSSFRPTIRINGKSHMAQRVMCFLAHGEPNPRSLYATHICGNGHLGCLNPNHLEWGTNSKNQLDRILHKTALLGENNPTAKLTNLQAKEISRRLYAGEKMASLAREYGCAFMAISKLAKGITWSSVTGRV